MTDEYKNVENQLRIVEAKYRALIEQIPAITYVDTPDTVTIYISPQVEKMLGYSQEECLSGGEFWAKLLHPDDLKRVRSEYQNSRLKGEGFTSEYRLKTKDGQMLWVYDQAVAVKNSSGEICFIQGVMFDITDKKLAEENLRKSEEKFRLIAENAKDMIYIYRLLPDRGFEYVNPAVIQIVGYTPKEHYEDPDLGLKIVHPDDQKLLESLANGENLSRPITLRWTHKNGSVVWVEQYNVPIYDADGKLTVIQGIARDISERISGDESIRKMAYYDALTGLPNRMLFKDRLEVELAHAKRNKDMVAIMFLDLDQFKIVNDTLGHNEGDQFLKLVSQKLQSLLRQDDTIARFGGDEFVIISPGIKQKKSVVNVAKRIIKVFEQPQTFKGHIFKVTVSIGISIFPEDAEDDDALLRYADIAMYRAKANGKNQYQLYRD